MSWEPTPLHFTYISHSPLHYTFVETPTWDILQCECKVFPSYRRQYTHCSTPKRGMKDAIYICSPCIYTVYYHLRACVIKPHTPGYCIIVTRGDVFNPLVSLASLSPPFPSPFRQPLPSTSVSASTSASVSTSTSTSVSASASASVVVLVRCLSFPYTHGPKRPPVCVKSLISQ